MFAWAVANEMVPAPLHHALRAVAGLRAGKCAAREPGAVRPVPEAWVDAVRDLVSPQVRAMIDLQLLTGMRPVEACALAKARETPGEL